MHIQAQVLDVGAGNGIAAGRVIDLDLAAIVGIGIIEEGEEAAKPCRQGVYAGYHVADTAELTPTVKQSQEGLDFSGMTVTAALGIGNIPPEAVAHGYNLVPAGVGGVLHQEGRCLCG